MTINKYILNGKLDIDPLITARNFLQKALPKPKTNWKLLELSKPLKLVMNWLIKLAEKYLIYEELYTVKEVFRIAGLKGLIPDTEP
jgi:hypothetical protein